MSGSRVSSPVDQLVAGLDTLAATDVTGVDDATLRQQLQELVTVENRVHAELIRRVDTFDLRGLSSVDGCRTGKAWLQAFCRVSGQVAHRLVKTARLLRGLPKLTEVIQTGDVSADHVQQVVRLADQIGAEHVAEVEPTLAEAAPVLDLSQFVTLTERVRAHLDPDGPDPAAAYDRRTLTISPIAGMVSLRGQLDPDGGAALMTALDAVMTPPADGDTRTAGQRRADALVELARRLLHLGELPTVGGQRPQVGVLVYPQALSPTLLAKLAQQQKDSFAAQRLRHFLADTDPGDTDTSDTGSDSPGDNETASEADAATAAAAETGAEAGADARVEASGARMRDAQPDSAATHDAEPDGPQARDPQPGDAASGRAVSGRAATSIGRPDWRDAAADVLKPTWSDSGWADPPFLNWFGAISHQTAQRLACDADLFRIVLDPSTGMPLDVGRAHRLVPYRIRKALYIRDRGCRFPGCTAPAEWTDAHHLDEWVEQGETKIERALLLCRYHHVQVHERGWSIDLNLDTGEVHVTRPDGAPYLIPRTRSASWNGPTTHAA